MSRPRFVIREKPGKNRTQNRAQNRTAKRPKPYPKPAKTGGYAQPPYPLALTALQTVAPKRWRTAILIVIPMPSQMAKRGGDTHLRFKNWTPLAFQTSGAYCVKRDASDPRPDYC